MQPQQEQHLAAPRGLCCSAKKPARNTCMEWKHPRSPATGKYFSSWTWRERKEARQRELRECSQDKNPTTHQCYKSHSPTPFGQTNLETHSLTRLYLRTSLDHWQMSRPIHSVIFILCKQGCVEFFFLFFPKDKCRSLLNTPSLNLHQHPQLSKNLTDAHTWQYSGSSWPYWKQRAKETKIQQKSSWP